MFDKEILGCEQAGILHSFEVTPTNQTPWKLNLWKTPLLTEQWRVRRSRYLYVRLRPVASSGAVEEVVVDVSGLKLLGHLFSGPLLCSLRFQLVRLRIPATDRLLPKTAVLWDVAEIRRTAAQTDWNVLECGRYALVARELKWCLC